MGKGKGHQSGAFGRKSQRALYHQEIQEQVQKQKQKKPQTAIPTVSKERPRLATSLVQVQLKGLLRERQVYEDYQLRERRRQQGFLPTPKEFTQEIVILPSHPPGWLVYHGEQNDVPRIEPLQQKCVTVLAKYLQEYVHAMGKEELQSIMSLLPSTTLAALSVQVSQASGMTDDLAYCLGKHAHVERLSFHAALQSDETLTDEGLLALVPRRHMPEETTLESWEDLEDDNTPHSLDLLQHLEGCSLRLRRLELVQCHFISFPAVEQLLSMCSWITHLSLAGSLSATDGPQVLLELPHWLPALQVLDLSQCGWVTAELLHTFCQTYSSSGRKRPSIYCKGCVTFLSNDNDEW